MLKEDASADDRHYARLRAAMPLAYYIGKMGVSYAQMLTRHGFGEDVQRVQEGWQRGMKSAMEAVSPRLLDSTSLVGTPEEVVARLDQWVADGVDEPLLSLPEGSLDDAGHQLSALKAALGL